MKTWKSKFLTIVLVIVACFGAMALYSTWKVKFIEDSNTSFVKVEYQIDEEGNVKEISNEKSNNSSVSNPQDSYPLEYKQK